jgi:hypothetical protein
MFKKNHPEILRVLSVRSRAVVRVTSHSETLKAASLIQRGAVPAVTITAPQETGPGKKQY